MTFLDLFAGIGGFRRGMELAGHKCVGFCENDNFAAASYVSMHLVTESQREHLATLDKKKRLKEILKEEYRNGEWYASDIREVRAEDVPRAECWCAGFPCQDISVAGKRLGFDGERSSLFFEIVRLLREQKEEDKPGWVLLENVKHLLSVSEGWVFARVLASLDEVGYDCEWEVFNSADWGVPQHRVRCYIAGRLRSRGPAKVFPLERADGGNRVPIRQEGSMSKASRKNPQAYRTYDPSGIAPCLNTMAGGGREPCVTIPFDVDRNKTTEEHGKITTGEEDALSDDTREMEKTAGDLPPNDSPIALAVNGVNWAKKKRLMRRIKDDGEPSYALTTLDFHGVAVGIDDLYNHRPARVFEGKLPTLRSGRADLKIGIGLRERSPFAYDGLNAKFNEGGASYALTTNCGSGGIHTGQKVCVPIEVPKEGDGGERHPGKYVRLSANCIVYAVWYEKYSCYIAIRRLMPIECARLQGWTDDYHEKAAFVNSDSQLYKQYGNGVTVSVVYEIAKKLAELEGMEAGKETGGNGHGG